MQTNNRRRFLKSTVGAGAGFAFAGTVTAFAGAAFAATSIFGLPPIFLNLDL